MSKSFLEALFHKRRCIMLQFAGLSVFWAVSLRQYRDISFLAVAMVIGRGHVGY